MTRLHPLQVLITAGNEEANIARVLQSVHGWADSIYLMLDARSTDRTESIASAYPVTIFRHPYDTPARQKNRALDQMPSQWTLILDADEEVTQHLRQAIDSLLSRPAPQHKAYWIHRKNQFMGRWIRYSGWQGDSVVRLILNDGTCRYPDVLVHEEMECPTPIGRLDGHILHYTYQGLDQYMKKIHRYASWQSQELYRKGTNPSMFHFVVKPMFRFIKHYFIQLGILDGIPGLAISTIQAWAVFERYLKLRDLYNQTNAS